MFSRGLPSTPHEHDLAAEAIDAFALSLGGREALAEALAIADSSPDVEQITMLLLDPRYAEIPLPRLCWQAGLTIAQLFAAYRKAALAKAHLASAQHIVTTLPEVVKDVMHRAAPYEISCGACQGTGSITDEPTEKRPNPAPHPCEPCQGHGRLLVLPDLDRQKLALELGQLITKGGGLAIQQTMILPPERAGTPGSLEQLQQAVGAILFPSQARETLTVDAEVQEVSTPPPPTEGA
jgi:hypothetical protein